MSAETFIEWSGKAEVYNFELAMIVGQNNVPGLEIAMNVSQFMD